MFYIVTARYSEDSSDGSTILGIYTDLDQATEIMRLYVLQSDSETIELLELKKNALISDFSNYKNTDKYESFGDYLSDNKKCSKIILHKNT